MNAPAVGSSALTIAAFGQCAAGQLLGRVGRARGEALEERQLRVAVRLPRAVELEVLVGQVRQDREVVGDPEDAIGGEAVRGRLDDRRRVAVVGHRPERSLQRRGARGRRVLGVRLAHRPDPGRDRADEPARDAGGLQRGRHEERRRRLAVRAGDPDDTEAMRRIAVPPGRRLGEGGRGSVDDELGQRGVRDRMVDDRGRGAGSAPPSRRTRGRRRGDPARRRTATPRRPAASRPSRRGSRRPASAAGPIARPSSRAPWSRPARAEPLDQPAERPRALRLGRPRAAPRSSSGPSGGVIAARPRGPARVIARPSR